MGKESLLAAGKVYPCEFPHKLRLFAFRSANPKFPPALRVSTNVLNRGIKSSAMAADRPRPYPCNDAQDDERVGAWNTRRDAAREPGHDRVILLYRDDQSRASRTIRGGGAASRSRQNRW